MRNPLLIGLAFIVGLLTCAGFASAQGPLYQVVAMRAHNNAMAATGVVGHGYTAGRTENVYAGPPTLFPRLAAIATWRGSPGHLHNLQKAPLRMVLGMQVKRTGHGVYVTARGGRR